MEKNNKAIGTKKIGKTYSSKFLKRNTLKGRGDKCIYVRPEYHEKLTRIVNIIAAGQIPLYAYLDNILQNHFELYSAEIIEDYNKNNKPILS
ncbi:DUF3408 domain-containing protein [Flavobacterium sp. ALJ2]|uniref:DUF3408 domain-containing protein n=1 Tax=Flavobacterium sp. ALJ2 TaxID=2786960 RepID=UPI00189F9386|nr:DUF3408 domain-containing protein [Flavobacterium sp. ALJ2]MBF7092601.1 DUF3408 domain-containing protein [Flavobacterium sp. ALJ2]